MSNLTPEFFNALILLVMLLGLLLAGMRLYRDLTRPLPPTYSDDEYVAWIKRKQQQDTPPTSGA